MKFISLVVLGLLLVLPAKAQSIFAPYVDGGIGYQTNQVSKPAPGNPQYNFGVGIESSTSRLLLDVNGQYSGYNLTGTGYQGTLNGSVYFKPVFHLLLGVGVEWQDLQLVNLKKQITLTGAHPYIGGGVQFKRDRFLVSYDLPVGKNAIPGESIVDFHNEIFLGNAHFRFTQDILVDSTKVTGTRTTSDSAVVGIKLVL